MACAIPPPYPDPLEPAPRPTRVELLAPAGNFEKLQIAIHYGADAVYAGGPDFSLRNQAGNFSVQRLREAVTYAHERGVKIYVTCNIFAHNRDLPGLERFLQRLKAMGPDGVIISDPGVVALARDIAPELPIHLSTQANTTNYRSARLWGDLGVARINAARELSLKEVARMAEAGGPEIEVFAHGAMCIAYSGRCLLSSYLAGRSANRGGCAQSCRWSYQVTEKSRPGQFLPLEEDQRGSYLFSSRDLCMLGHLPELIGSGVRALKIEGRMKGVHYLATVVGAYRRALDAYYADPRGYQPEAELVREVALVSRRGLSTGFYFGDPAQIRPQYDGPPPQESHLFIAKVLDRLPGKRVRVEVRNRLAAGMAVDVISPGRPVMPDRIEALGTPDGHGLETAQTGQEAILQLTRPYHPWDLIRRAADRA